MTRAIEIDEMRKRYGKRAISVAHALKQTAQSKRQREHWEKVIMGLKRANPSSRKPEIYGEYNVLCQYLSALINNDWSGLDREEADALRKWIKSLDLPPGHWDYDHDDDEGHFGRDEVTGLKGNVCTVRWVDMSHLRKNPQSRGVASGMFRVLKWQREKNTMSGNPVYSFVLQAPDGRFFQGKTKPNAGFVFSLTKPKDFITANLSQTPSGRVYMTEGQFVGGSLLENPRGRSKRSITRVSQITKRMPTKRLILRRQKTLRAPKGYFANPMSSNSPMADHWVVRTTRNNTVVGRFPSLETAKAFAQWWANTIQSQVSVEKEVFD